MTRLLQITAPSQKNLLKGGEGEKKSQFRWAYYRSDDGFGKSGRGVAGAFFCGSPCQTCMKALPNVFTLVSRSTASDSHEGESPHGHDVLGEECQEIYNSVKEGGKK